MRANESWLSWEFSSAFVDYHQLGQNERNLSLTLKKNLMTFKVDESQDESAREFKAKRKREFQLLSALILVALGFILH